MVTGDSSRRFSVSLSSLFLSFNRPIIGCSYPRVSLWRD